MQRMLLRLFKDVFVLLAVATAVASVNNQVLLTRFCPAKSSKSAIESRHVQNRTHESIFSITGCWSENNTFGAINWFNLCLKEIVI